MKIVHIAIHLGAGAGKAVSGIAISDKNNEHKIVLLDRPKKYDHIKRCEECGVKVEICPTEEEERKDVSEADAVVVNWWHHPLTYRTLFNINDIPSRLIFWSHVNGLHYPVLKPEFISCFDACMFTSRASYENTGWNEQERKKIHENASVVYGMGDFRPENFPGKKDYEINQETFRVGYVGSLDYAKLHPDFTDWLRAAIDSNRNLIFEIAGDVTGELEQDVIKKRLSDHVKFLGFQENIERILSRWDAFIYPLNPDNFATTENALLEAMACALPVVASDGIVERTIIRNGKEGLLVRDEDSFAAELNRLSKDHELRRRLGKNARKKVVAKYDIEKNVLRFDSVAGNLAKNIKTTHDFRKVIGEEPFEWFLSGCGVEDAKKLEYLAENDRAGADEKEVRQNVLSLKGIFKGDAKASVRQYSSYFPKDRRLKALASVIERYQEDI